MSRPAALLEACWFGLVGFAALWLGSMALWDARFDEPTCASGGCLTVQTSPWARPFGGPPLSLWGCALAGALALRALALRRAGRAPWTDGWAACAQTAAVAAAVAATAYSGFVLRAACADCLVAAGAVLLAGFLFGLAALAGTPASRSGVAPLLAALAIAALPVAALRGADLRHRLDLERRFQSEALPEVRGPEALAWGRPDAPAALVAFLDFRCWACQLLLRQAAKPVRAGQLRLVVLHAPLHSDRELAEVAHAAALEGRFEELLRALEEAGEPGRSPWEWAESRWPGIRSRRGAAASRVVARQAALARRLGIVQTPTVFALGPDGRCRRRPWLECLPAR
ncbi:MAG: DsbA family protein [Fimbriimonadaceae bacterium]